jgi:hypothetical protein
MLDFKSVNTTDILHKKTWPDMAVRQAGFFNIFLYSVMRGDWVMLNADQ